MNLSEEEQNHLQEQFRDTVQQKVEEYKQSLQTEFSAFVEEHKPIDHESLHELKQKVTDAQYKAEKLIKNKIRSRKNNDEDKDKPTITKSKNFMFSL